MSSVIDPTLPTSAAPRVSHIRQNFYAAMTEINALQISNGDAAIALANATTQNDAQSITIAQMQAQIAQLQAAAGGGSGGAGAPSDAWRSDAILRFMDLDQSLAANVWQPIKFNAIMLSTEQPPQPPAYSMNWGADAQATQTHGLLEWAYTLSPLTTDVIAQTRFGSDYTGFIIAEPSTHIAGQIYTTHRSHTRTTGYGSDFELQIKVNVACQLQVGAYQNNKYTNYCMTSRTRNAERTTYA